MKTVQPFGALGATLLAATLAACASAPHVEPVPSPSSPPEPPTEQHRWLHQLVGEWDVVYQSPDTGGDGFRLEVTETVRSLAGRWILSEGVGDEFMSVLTLGYDPELEAFVGIWIDNHQTRLWHFQGELDEASGALRLHAEGPSVFDPSETVQYREALEFLAPDHKRVISSILQPDGTWSTYMTATARRRN